ncbi:MAG: hypothetical protein QNJ29_06120 [Rhizobiaceae bacterium]|nr:hypothetical protein [Rhizobiaceae bacterium]
MTRYSDAALLKGDFATMLKNPPKEAEWKKASCDDGSEAAAQAIAKQIFGFQQSLDPKKEKLEVVTFSSLGPIKVLGLSPMDGELMRIDGVNPSDASPVSIVQHVEQLSLTFTKAPVQSDNPEEHPDDDDGLQIGFVIFDELKERKKTRDAAKRKKPATRKRASKK